MLRFSPVFRPSLCLNQQTSCLTGVWFLTGSWTRLMTLWLIVGGGQLHLLMSAFVLRLKNAAFLPVS